MEETKEIAMRVSQLSIENFRGIKRLDWRLPADQRLITLVGPGDSGKSTILDAIHLLLGDRWSVSFSDVDFYHVDPTRLIQIKALLTDVPDSLLKDNTFGFWQSGLDADGQVHQEPEDGLESCLLVRLTVDESLEPQWEVVRVDGEAHNITSSQRREFSTFRVDDRTDAQLRWTRTSALGRMSAKDGAEREALAAAERAAREALHGHGSAALNKLVNAVQNHANEIGGSDFKAIGAGLDSSHSGMGANLALYEDTVPLMAYGLGSRRLVSLAVQQMAAGERAIAVIDELENGLEPHRAVRLLNYLDADPYSQVFVTTHSPVVVEQAPIESLSVVQTINGEVTITSLGGAGDVMKALRRAAPSSLLARKVVIGEGKTEHGVLAACFDAWDQQRSAAGLTTAAGEGLAIQDGNGGEKAVNRAEAMVPLGCSVLALIDNDVRTTDPHVTKAKQAGATVVRWEDGLCIESQVCSQLDADELQEFISLGIERRGADSTVLDDVKTVGHAQVPNLIVKEWLGVGLYTIEDARRIVASAASNGRRGWFKNVDGGGAPLASGCWHGAAGRTSQPCSQGSTRSARSCTGCLRRPRLQSRPTLMGSDELIGLAAEVVAEAPCSLEMPAGTGKTELLAACVATVAQRGERSLVLTHTNAGVDAIRKRLRRFGVRVSMVRVETITSWAFTLSRSYPSIAGITVPEVPNWKDARAYVDGAALVAATSAVRKVHATSFGYLFVDEYQDCALDQHELILEISKAVPRTVILGDRLQAIFGFDRDRPIVDWGTHVTPNYPPKTVPCTPHRWRDHNAALGQWLLDIRPLLVDGGTFDFSSQSVPGLEWRQCDVKTAVSTVNSAAYSLSKATGSVVLLDKWARDVAKHASHLGGSYAVMEDVGGRFMADHLDVLPAENDMSLASWLAHVAKSCFVGLSGLDAAVQRRLENGRTISGLKRKGLAPVQAALDELVGRPVYAQLLTSASAIRATPKLALYRQEAWDDTFHAVARSVEDGTSPQEALAVVRDRLRRGGRADRQRIASRTLLVKGLEFDHVIVANVQNFTDPRQLYVAMSRARTSVTVIGRSPRLQLRYG